MITAAQCRAARGLLQWSREDLAGRSDVALRTIVDFEREARSPIANTLKALRAAFEAEGVSFSEEGCICPPAKSAAKAKGKKK